MSDDCKECRFYGSRIEKLLGEKKALRRGPEGPWSDGIDRLNLRAAMVFNDWKQHVWEAHRGQTANV